MGNLSIGVGGSSYYAHARYGSIFCARAIVTAPVIFSTAAGTGGPLLWNNTAGLNAVILGVTCAQTVVTTVAAALGITGASGQTTAPSSTTAIDTSGNLFVGGAAPQMNVYRVGTPTNAGTFFLPLLNVSTGALTTGMGSLAYIDLQGRVVVPPGSWCAVAASATASTVVANSGRM